MTCTGMTYNKGVETVVSGIHNNDDAKLIAEAPEMYETLAAVARTPLGENEALDYVILRAREHVKKVRVG